MFVCGYRNPWLPKADDIALIVAGSQTNPLFQVGNLSYCVSVSIDKC